MAQALSNDDPWWYSGIVLPIMTLSCLLWPARSDFFSRCRNSRQDDWEKGVEMGERRWALAARAFFQHSASLHIMKTTDASAGRATVRY